MINNIEKWIQTIKISWSNMTTYRLNLFLQVIGPGLVFFFVKYSLWSSIYQGDPSLVINGYSFSQMIQYHAWSMVTILLTQGVTGNNLSEDIRLGRISNYLIYPFNFWEFHFASFISSEILQIIIATVTIFFISFTSIFGELNFEFMFHGFSYCIFVSTFWFLAQYLTGIISFWLEETWIIRVMLNIVSVFLSGAIIPLDFFPTYLQEILIYTPFPYLTYYPVKIFSGEMSFLPTGYLVLSIWIIILIFVNKLVWRKGLKMYTAAGM